ncbi:TonB-dependent receptor [Mucilaginibacter sp. KACC 22063]|uniref:TonB-dependent receptor n=1 Tax=Mucilaginibacter sp. KACC 22063 TaxID=3025666 RepID=UPI002365C7B0|nr:carboxypeptidase regulatory-like domain-containing protein [Mucilaginibacter sp. KACC 22063]WDF57007.1 carboxypeptidase regulatory-like domain-containing protein [Mucilaginibacter sp. KACC 22063]
MRKQILLSVLFLFAAVVSFAQVTTGSFTGTIKDSKGLPLPGATIVATHVPTGTNYSTTSRGNGDFTIPNVRAGGPYTVKISFIGFATRTFTDLNASLGTPTKLDITLLDEGKTLAEVNVTAAKKGSVISAERKGPSTNVSAREIQSLPTITRSVQDFARLTPQAVSVNSSSDGSPLGIQFGGQSNKFNQFTVDGAMSNDVFGLANSGTNGGQAGANPIPIESIQELQIVLAPYDVTQGGFTGGGINAVTKSGTNEVHGSAYGYLQNQNFVGKSPSTDLKYQNFKNNTYGFTLGAPIVKNKLFFFGNYERIDNSTPLANDPAQAGSGSKFDPAVLQQLRDFVQKTYNFDIGDSYGNINKNQGSHYAFGRLDWNINDRNKLTVRHSYSDGENFSISRSPTTIFFTSNGYTFKTKNNSAVAELNSSFSSGASNVLRLTYTATRDRRSTADFPQVYIQESGLNYNFGGDGSSVRNSLAQDSWTLTDNFTIYKNKHTITFGTDNLLYKSNNVFLQYYYGYYNKYTSIAQFENNQQPPANYSAYYSNAGGNDNANQILKAAQLAVYGQDVWSISDKFKLTYGLRIDMPVFLNSPAENVAFNATAIAQQYGVQTNKAPKSTPLFAPRVGFNYDVNGDGTTQLRGGAGIFTGRVPFVWISNQYGGTGVTITKFTAGNSTNPSISNIKFHYDPNDPHLGAQLGASNAPSEIDLTDKNFKFTQTVRANFAIDQKLPFWGLIGTLEGIYTKKINDINYQNLNLTTNVTNVTLGNTTRPFYNFTRANNSYTDVIYMTNTSKGYAYNLTAQIQKPFSKGWSGSIAYTYGHSTSLNDGTSSTAISNWRFAYNVNGLNSLDVSRSNYDPGSRVVGYVSKRFSYLNNRMSTTVGLVYIGQSGQTLSYLYNQNINGDDASSKGSSADLVYLPTTLAQAQFAPLKSGTTTISPQQQFDDYMAYVNSNPYLKKHLGQNTQRNGDRLPWENHFDLKVQQDFRVYKTHTLSVTFDAMNVGNLLNKDWGHSYYASNQSVSLFQVVTQGANPTFNFDKTKLNTVEGKQQAYIYNDYLSRWRGQLSVRYSF